MLWTQEVRRLENLPRLVGCRGQLSRSQKFAADYISAGTIAANQALRNPSTSCTA
jgi:hypothetical protein